MRGRGYIKRCQAFSLSFSPCVASASSLGRPLVSWSDELDLSGGEKLWDLHTPGWLVHVPSRTEADKMD